MSNECHECMELLAEIGRMQYELNTLRERCNVLMNLINEVNAAIKEGRIEVDNR